MRISVTQKHIANGERGSYGHCPVALAMREVGLENVRVAYEVMWYGSWAEAARPTPPEVRAFMTVFDDYREGYDEDPQPFEFDLP